VEVLSICEREGLVGSLRESGMVVMVVMVEIWGIEGLDCFVGFTLFDWKRNDLVQSKSNKIRPNPSKSTHPTITP